MGPYALGVDLGTTFTAAATYRDGRVEIASLGSRSAAVPSVVFLKENEEVLTGEAANRRGATEPGRVAREFKRRVGDTTPIFLGGTPHSAEAVMSRLLRWVVAEISRLEGGAPANLALSHPANWGPYKQDLLRQAVHLADLPEATYLTEPEAAAMHYSSQERLGPGQVVAVYDLGGGTFDAAVLRKTEHAFEILGEPEGIERLGGIDFDAAVYAHVTASLGDTLEQLDDQDPGVLAAVARLRQECVDTKEVLSTDTDATIPVLLPDVHTEVRLTRAEFEAMIRPALADSIDAMRRALRSANVEAEDVAVVLLVGGSSRVPLVAQLVGAELGRPVAVDAHPKHTIALGAALASGQAAGMVGAVEEVTASPGADEARGADAAGVSGDAPIGPTGPIAVDIAPSPGVASPYPAAELTPSAVTHLQATWYQPTHQVPRKGLPAWTQPDPDLPIAARLDPGLDVQLLQWWGDWALIACSNGWRAWVNGRRLERLRRK